MGTEWTYDRNGRKYIINEDMIVANCTMCGHLCTQQKDAIGPYSTVRATSIVKDMKSFCECCFTLPKH